MNWDCLLDHAPALLVGIPLFAAFLTPSLSKVSPKLRDWWVLFIAIITELLVIVFAYHIYTTGPEVYVFGGSPATVTLPAGSTVPVRIIFNIDAMSMFMVFISSTLFLLGVIYSSSFIRDESGKGKYHTLLLLMVVGMFGLELTGDLFNLFVFFEILSISSAALVAFRIDRVESLEAGLKYMILSVMAGLFLLFAIGIFYGQYDALNIGILAERLQYNTLDQIALVILIAVFAMKCGSVPMHMWKPDAYGEAPAPISMVLVASGQASLYALFRVTFTLYGVTLNTQAVAWVIIFLGVVSMFVGITMALVQKDVKRFIAYCAISQTGYMLMAVGVALATLYLDPDSQTQVLDGYGYTAATGGLFHLLNDAIVLGLLFLVAGAIVHRTGTSDLNEMGGLAHRMPWTTGFFLIGGLALAGIPPFNSFSSKLLIYESVYNYNPILTVFGLVFSMLTLAAFVKIFHSAFMGPPLKKFRQVREVPKSMLIPMGVLVVAIIGIGLFPDIVVERFVEPAVDALVDKLEYINRIRSGGA